MSKSFINKRWEDLSKNEQKTGIVVLIISAVAIFVFIGSIGDNTEVRKTTQNQEESTSKTDNENSDSTISTQNQESETSVDEQNVVETNNNSDSATVQSQPAQTQNELESSSETVSQRNAVRSARTYLNYSAFSRNGLVEQLEYEQFPHADAVYGADNSGADWYEQAAKSAEAYMEYSAFSRGGLIEQLKYEGFTQAQAEHGADTVGL